MDRIAIEPNLSPIRDYLAGKGYKVESINFSDQPPKKLSGYDAFVVTGLNSNFLGIHNTGTNAVVINADGLTPEEVARELDRRKQNS
jgi:hypothetical protein